MDEKFAEYKQAVTTTTKWATELRAAWSRDYYYLHLQTYKTEDASQILVLEDLPTYKAEAASQHFVSEALCALLPDTQKSDSVLCSLQSSI